MSIRVLATFLTALILVLLGAPALAGGGTGSEALEWTLVNRNAMWEPRAGLHVVELDGRLFLMGGRTPRDSTIPGDSDIWADVWVSDDQGASWTKILDTEAEGHWPARAYFQAVTKRGFMYVLGGQDYALIPNPDPTCTPGDPGCPPLISASNFFNDVWRSRDGIHWKQLTDDAGWEGRAGLRSVVFRGEIYVFGGSVNDDSAIIGPMGPPRIYFNDVWKSRNGRDWELLTDDAPWAARAGAVVVVKDDHMYLLGGEEGFVCEPLPFCDPPYFNDVWRSQDGANWELVTAAADWVARPGHQCAVVADKIICFGGFGLLANPMDVWGSADGANWRQISDSPWDAVSHDEIKYDFEALVLRDPENHRPKIFTFGGDRETFDFTDPLNYLRVDNDVWSFGPVTSDED